jgi:hypothetical protein
MAVAFERDPPLTTLLRLQLAFVAVAIACAGPRACHADATHTAKQPATAVVLEHAATARSEAPPVAISRLSALWNEAWRKLRPERPDWLSMRSGTDPLAADMAAPRSFAQLLLQDERPDGIEWLTVRYNLHRATRVNAYAGAGLSRTEYFFDDAEDSRPAMFIRRNRRGSLGAAAELGAEFRLSERMQVNADLRWIELDDAAQALRGEHGPVSAAPWVLGLAFGYRFR